jgi:hypothetical protein
LVTYRTAQRSQALLGGRSAGSIVGAQAASRRFSFIGTRYEDGRHDLRVPMRTHFRESAAEYNAVVFSSSNLRHRSGSADVSELDPAGYDLV